jgi:hypothetical protein
VSAFYWERHPDGPFATLIAVAATYCGPDAYDGAYQDLVRRAREADADDDEMRVFKAELRHALADPAALPDEELSEAVEYDDGTDERFLRRVWRDLYGEEPAANA